MACKCASECGVSVVLAIVWFTLLTFSPVAGVSEAYEDAANCLWLLSNSKPCANCKSPIQKNEGCNHMQCAKVGRHAAGLNTVGISRYRTSF